MINLYNKFIDIPEYAPDQNVAGEATSRLPYALFGPTIVTHFPLFDRSEETDLFGASHESNHLERRRRQVQDFLIAQIDKKLPIRLTDKLKRQFAQKHSAGAVEEVVKRIWTASQQALKEICEKKPQLLVFNAKTLINLEINRRVHDTVAKALSTRTKPWDADKLLIDDAFFHANRILFVFLQELDKLLDESTRQELPPSESGVAIPTDHGDRKDTDHDSLGLGKQSPIMQLGGLICWYNVADKLDVPKSGISATNLETRRLYACSEDDVRWLNNHEAVIDKYLVWRRGDRNWQYTFCEGIFGYSNCDSNCVPKLREFISRLLASRVLIQSFPDAPNFPHSANEYPFPGFRVAGAQYFVIPAELLLYIVAGLKKLPAAITDAVIVDGPFTSTDGSNIGQCLEKLHTLDRKLLGQDQSLATLLEDAGLNIDDPVFLIGLMKIRKRIQALRARIVGQSTAEPGTQLEFRLREDAAVNWQSDEFYQLFAALSELLWKSIYSDKAATADSRKYNIGFDDFVSSVVIDGKAIYFSNFRPYEDEKFTRTFFIDFELTPYQRGRLVRRLCDVATYRMSCVKDLYLFHALQGGINQLNKEFNKNASRVAMQELEQHRQAVLDDTLSLYRRAIRFDMFVAEGVSGRRRAAEGDWQRVKRQVEDIREKRISGYAQLGDFLERGLAVAVLEISRASDRYENLLVRIRDLMSVLRTQLTADQTIDVLTTVTKIQKATSAHTIILWIAIVLSWVGVIYYGSTLRAQVVSGEFEADWVLGFAGLILLVLMAGAVMTFWLDKLGSGWRSVWRWCKGLRN